MEWAEIFDTQVIFKLGTVLKNECHPPRTPYTWGTEFPYLLQLSIFMSQNTPSKHKTFV